MCALQAEMAECMLFAMKFVEELKDDSLKDKEVGCVFDLLKTLKTLFRRCGMMETAIKVDTLRLTTTLRMFKTPHYNAKMNALKEVHVHDLYTNNSNCYNYVLYNMYLYSLSLSLSLSGGTTD